MLRTSTLEENPVSAATLEKDRQMVAAPEKALVFLARRAELKLVIKRSWDRKDGEGNVVETIPGEHVRFVDGVLRVPASGRMRGEHGEDLDAKDVLTFLLGDEANGRLPHHLLGDKFDGFWRHDEPAPAPTDEERQTLAELAMELDVDGLARFISQEEEGWCREELLSVARTSLERAKSKQEERDQELADARAAGEAAAKAPSGPSRSAGDGQKGAGAS